jgi:DNA mismatch repair protein MutL
MNRIHLLSEQIANQIAAGEVIERPASVVKELVENALDAGARHITVEVQAGGRACIRVIDDGSGMSRDDALLCLERHATSKVRTARDLEAITTMGFRGEALPSIASVSRFTLTTRERESNAPEGTQVVMHGGKIQDVRSAGHAPGTTVEVRQLFYNLPARRKFLRSEETERSHLQHTLTLAALAHAEVGFSLLHDQRLIWQLPPAAPGQPPLSAVRERLRALLGGDLSLLAVDYHSSLPSASPADDEGGLAQEGASTPAVRVWGFMGGPGVSRATREDQHLFVNRRPIEHRGLNYALLEGYHTALMKGRYPVCCLFLEISPGEVDVNVHPTKKEVKFRHESAVRSIVTRAIRETLLQFHSGAGAARTRSTEVAPAVPPARQVECATPALLPAAGRTAARPEPAEPPVAPRSPPEAGRRSPLATEPPAGIEVPPVTAGAAPTPMVAPPRAVPEVAPSVGSAGTPPAPLLQIPLRLLGVVGKLYAVLESDRGLVLMDQHAAHERVLYEQMLGRLESGGAASQRLLLPETVEVASRDAQFLRENLAVFGRLGVGLSEFGDRTFLLDALPPFVKVADARRFVLELVDELSAAGTEVNPLRLGEQTVAKTVCRHAVKARDPLDRAELEHLLRDLRQCAMPYTCPHGRPTLVEMSYRELEKKFGRIV